MNKTGKIAFVCLHGSAKSLIAAEYFNRLARETGSALVATTSGPEPDPEVPGNVVEGLSKRQIDVRGYRPMLISAAGLADADLIVSFACEAGAALAPGKPVERWDGCPAVSADFETAWGFITGHVDELIKRLESNPATATRLEQGS
jgi:arsenate reductase (thioredoxin)